MGWGGVTWPQMQDHGDGDPAPGARLGPEALTGRWEFVDSPNSQAFVEFTEYGSWFGSDGCNAAGSGWHIDGDSVVVGTGSGHTFVACASVSLPTGGSIGELQESGDLEFRSADGSTVALTRTSARAATLAGGTWEVMPLLGQDPRVTPQPMLIDFQRDGTWTGVDRCNSLAGTWSWERTGAAGVDTGYGGVLHFGEDTASTLAGCSVSPRFIGHAAGDIEFRFTGRNEVVLWTPLIDDPDLSRATATRYGL